jgi:geranylgeranylglycerol-phosphate geranylgeranyltransferase
MTRRINEIFEKIKHYIFMIRPQISVMALTGGFIGGAINGLEYITVDLFIAVIVVFLMLGGANAFNDYFDREIDKIIHPKRAIPSGNLTEGECLKFAYLTFGLSLVLSLIINIYCFLIVVFTIFLLVLYEKIFKEMALLGNILAGFLGGMAFVFGGMAVGKPYTATILALMAFLIMLAREILMDVRDIKGDSIQRITLPMKIGVKNAIYFGCICIIGTVLITPLPLLYNILNWKYLLLLIPADILFLYSIYLVLKNVNNTGKTTNIIRTAGALGLIGFVLGVSPYF